MNYIIDFERINELTLHPADGRDNSAYGSTSIYSVTKNLVKSYMEIYEDRNRKKNRNYNDEEIQEAIDILIYNKILISPADIRDQKIDKILEK